MAKDKDSTTHVGPNGRGKDDYEEQAQTDFGNWLIEQTEKQKSEQDDKKAGKK